LAVLPCEILEVRFGVKGPLYWPSEDTLFSDERLDIRGAGVT
jgi:hypothetical protein